MIAVSVHADTTIEAMNEGPSIRPLVDVYTVVIGGYRFQLDSDDLCRLRDTLSHVSTAPVHQVVSARAPW